MNTNEQTYLSTLKDILHNGVDQLDRTQTGTRSIFGKMDRYNLKEGFPLITTRNMNIKTAISELLWMIEGSGDERRLAEIRYGKPRDQLVGKTTIWTANAAAPYWRDKSQYDGDLGRVYGVQWRNWNGGVDQLSRLIDGLKNDPMGRRHIISAWNPGELEQMALPPCHMTIQFYVRDSRLSCLFYMRSNDYVLGAPTNLAFYAAFTMMIAQVVGLEVGELIHTIGDAHIYSDHIEGVEEQLTRVPYSPPKLIIDPTIKCIEDFKMEHFTLVDYQSHPTIKFKMAV